MKHKINLDSWIRKDHFNFFNKFDEPYYSLNVNIDCTVAYQTARQNGVSFFPYYLYQSLAASQVIDAFTLRIDNNEVYKYDQINAESTIARPDGTFGFGNLPYYPTFAEFYANALKVVEKVQSERGLSLPGGENVIRYSALPWIDFTSLSHARMFSFKDSCPKISFGKMTEHNGKRSMPVSIHVNHALVDGIDVGKYIDCYQELMNKPL